MICSEEEENKKVKQKETEAYLFRFGVVLDFLFHQKLCRPKFAAIKIFQCF